MTLLNEAVSTSSYTENLDSLLTKREKEILIQIAKGLSNKEISKNLELSYATVRNHISNIFEKLEINNRAQATAIAIYAGFLTPWEIVR